jgi:aspartyl-tRNA(Asn)/glutamyl-tRNA(Gln) amidotransferase subunit A
VFAPEPAAPPAEPARVAAPALPARGRIAAAARALRAGTVTCVELVDQALERIARDNAELVAFVEVLADAARAEAAQRDAELAAGIDRGPLHGIPVSVKDVIHVRGATTRCGSDAFEALPDRDAVAVARWRDAGAIVLGKTSTHEFALGVTNPQARNPHDRTRIPGGSSGGSAIAVACGMGFGSLGTDTRASVRVPAALCGVVGLKATYGTVPTEGIVPLAWTMDHAGVLAPTAADAAVLLDALRPAVPPIAPTAIGGRVDHLRVGLPGAAWEGAEPLVVAAVEAMLVRLRERVAAVADVDRPSPMDLSGANAMGMIVSRTEAAAAHRTQGIDRARLWAETRDQLDAADAVLAIDYLDAQRYRQTLREELLAVFATHDVLAMPTVPVLAPTVATAGDHLTVLSRNAIPWSFVGFPVISIPCPAAGLPVGLQLVAAPGGEATLIALATALDTEGMEG